MTAKQMGHPTKDQVTAMQEVFTAGQNKYQEDLNVIRSMMERSARFISLSGLSGVAAGLIAMIGGIYALFLVQKEGWRDYAHTSVAYSADLFTQLFILALLTLVLALTTAVYFTVRKSKA